MGGHGFLKVFNNSLPKALATIFPELNWKPWKFQSIPLEWWNTLENRKAFLEDARKELNITTWEDWQDVLFFIHFIQFRLNRMI